MIKWIVPLMCVWLVGCHSQSTRPVDVIAMPLLAVHDFGRSLQLQQRVSGEYPGGRHELLCVLELHRNRVSLVGLSPQGLKLFTLQYDGNTLVIDKSPLVPKQLQPQQVLADIQLALWPEQAIKNHLDRPWRVQQDSRVRELFYENNLAAAVRYEMDDPMQGAFTLTNHNYGYSLRVETLEIIVL